MATPLITPASVTVFASGTPANFSIPISSAQSGRVLALYNLSKCDTTIVSLVNTLAFDSAGVNATLAGGQIIEQGITQIAQEGIRSSQCGAYFLKDSVLPNLAGSYLFEPVFDSAGGGNIDRFMWICFEILGCPDEAFDNMIENFGTNDIGGGIAFSDLITPVDDDCLIIDVWALSHSNQPTITSTELQVAAIENQNNASGVVSQYNQVGAPVQKAMIQNSSTLHQRRAWKLFSFSGVSSALPDLDSTISIVNDDSVTAISVSKEESASISVLLENSITNISLETEQRVALANILENTIPLIFIGVEQRATLSSILSDSITSISSSKEEAALISVQLDSSITSIQSESIINSNINNSLGDNVTKIFTSTENSASSALELILENSITNLNITTEIKADLNLILGDSVTSITTIKDLRSNLDLLLGDSQTSIVVSGVLIKNGLFIKIVNGHETVVKKVSNSEVFTKIVGGHEIFTKRVAA